MSDDGSKEQRWWYEVNFCGSNHEGFMDAVIEAGESLDGIEFAGGYQCHEDQRQTFEDLEVAREAIELMLAEATGLDENDTNCLAALVAVGQQALKATGPLPDRDEADRKALPAEAA